MATSMLGLIGIARNTAMTSAFGREGTREVQAEFDRLEERLAAQIGAAGMFHSVDLYFFYDACARLARAASSSGTG